MADSTKIRFAVVGLGHFAQTAILPAFANSSENSVLAALVTSDPAKAIELGKKYKVPTFSYDEYERLLNSGDVDAVYIAVPNSEHCKFAIPAAKAKVHVLCEKPLAYSVMDAEQMISACAAAEVKLMTAYRLHFEAGNLDAIEVICAGGIGEPRLFSSIHTMQVDPDNIRIDLSLGGGPVEDIGIYCINAARYIFQSDPEEVLALSVHGNDPRFEEVPETVSVTLRFPGDRIASFLCGFGQTKMSEYRVIGTEGTLMMDPAYTWQGDIVQTISHNGKDKTRTFKHRDQIAAELLYFSNCILTDQTPEPSGTEGLIDVIIIDAVRRAYTTRQPISIETPRKSDRPHGSQNIQRKPHSEPETVNAAPPSKS